MEQSVKDLQDSVRKLKRAVQISIGIVLFGSGFVAGFAVGLFIGGS